METWQAFILGIIEGLTEFLPVSSTFHLIFTSQLLGLENSEFLKMFEVFIQAGAILAVLILYIKELINDKELIKKTMLSFIPTGVISFMLYPVIKNVFFESHTLMLSAFILFGLIFLIYERYGHKHLSKEKELKQISYTDSLLIGLSQTLAIIPGISRSGIIILTMMMLGYKRDRAAKYSFFLAIPTILAAASLDIFKLQVSTPLLPGEIQALVIGFVGALLVALLVLRWFISFLQKNTLSSFGFYRIALGLLLVWLI